MKLKLLFMILDEGYDKKVTHLLDRFGIRFKTVTNAIGTASPSLLDYFGLVETRKEIFMAILPDSSDDRILKKMATEFELAKEGTGVAFTIPIASANKYLSDQFTKKEEEEKSDKMKELEIKYHLIITIVFEGYLNQVMTAAKRAGANGGTVIKGRGLAHKQASKILGFNIEPEREVVLTIVDESIKTKVMEEITKEVGIKTPGKGICISLPVDQAVGFNERE